MSIRDATRADAHRAARPLLAAGQQGSGAPSPRPGRSPNLWRPRKRDLREYVPTRVRESPASPSGEQHAPAVGPHLEVEEPSARGGAQAARPEEACTGFQTRGRAPSRAPPPA